MIAFFLFSILSAAITLLTYRHALPKFTERLPTWSVFAVILLILSPPLLYMIASFVNEISDGFISLPPGLAADFPLMNRIRQYFVEALAGLTSGYIFGHWLYFFRTRFTSHQRRWPIRGDDIVTIFLIGFIMFAIHPAAPFSSFLGRVQSIATPVASLQFFGPSISRDTRHEKTRAPGGPVDQKQNNNLDQRLGDLKLLAYGVWTAEIPVEDLKLRRNRDDHLLLDYLGQPNNPHYQFVSGYIAPFFLCHLLYSGSPIEGKSWEHMLKLRGALFSLLTEDGSSKRDIDSFVEQYKNLIKISLEHARVLGTIDREEAEQACSRLVYLVESKKTEYEKPIVHYLKTVHPETDEGRDMRREEFSVFLYGKDPWSGSISNIVDSFVETNRADIEEILKRVFCVGDSKCREESKIMAPWGAMSISMLASIQENKKLAIEPLEWWWKKYGGKIGKSKYYAINLLDLYVAKLQRLKTVNLMIELRYRKNLIQVFEELMFETEQDLREVMLDKKYCQSNRIAQEYFVRYLTEVNDIAYRVAQRAERKGEGAIESRFTMITELKEAQEDLDILLRVDLECLYRKVEEKDQIETRITTLKMGFLDTKLKVLLAEFRMAHSKDEGATEEWYRRFKEFKEKVEAPYEKFRRIVRRDTEDIGRNKSIVLAMEESELTGYLEEFKRKYAILAEVIQLLKPSR